MSRPMIIGGRPSRPGQWPWQVSLQIIAAIEPWHSPFYGDIRNWRVVLSEDNLEVESGRYGGEENKMNELPVHILENDDCASMWLRFRLTVATSTSIFTTTLYYYCYYHHHDYYYYYYYYYCCYYHHHDYYYYYYCYYHHHD
nr:hypothetical protein BaRGS_009880 [Batillaria attramentaria]